VIRPFEVEALVRAALLEDAPFGDPFGDLFPHEGTGLFLAKEDGVLCGTEVAVEAYRQVDPMVLAVFAPEGTAVKAGTQVGEARGPVSSLLRGERISLNFLQRLSGVATLTARYVAALEGTGTVLLDTRKTTPLFRNLEKHAVRTGGGRNHRFSLSDGILVKENGIRAAGGVAEAVAAARKAAHHLARVEVEVETLDEAAEAVAAGAEALLLDNMAPGTVAEAARLYKGKVFLEASGGITLETVRAYAEAGADAVSVGALTHSARGLDLSFELVP
jgi:nicotinate-nucleotide pyrophosphorylase (carboxylating)